MSSRITQIDQKTCIQPWVQVFTQAFETASHSVKNNKSAYIDNFWVWQQMLDPSSKKVSPCNVIKQTSTTLPTVCLAYWAEPEIPPAIAQNITQSISSANHNVTRHRQHFLVRQLLNALLNYYDIDDELDESFFPYRLRYSGAYVCFSHTKMPACYTHCVVALSQHRPIAIDIERREISWQVACRFFHNEEVAILTALDIDRRNQLIQILWQIKECWIKQHNLSLVSGLAVSFSELIHSLSLLVTQEYKSTLPQVLDFPRLAEYHLVIDQKLGLVAMV